MEIVVTEHITRVICIKPKGRLDAFNVSMMQNHLDNLFEKGATNFVIDLSEVLFLDSAGMSILVNSLKRAQQANGDIRLIWPTEEAARRVLRLTRFDRVFEIKDTVEAAVRNF